MGVKLLTAPAAEPVSLDEAKTFARVDHAAEDDLIDSLVAEMRQRCEKVSWRALITQTWKLTLDDWPRWGCRRCIRLPRPPVQSVTSVTYLATDGTRTTLAANQYLLDTTVEPATITEAYGVSWPTVRVVPGSIEVTFVAGYGLAVSVPSEIKGAIKNAVAYCYRHRTDRDEQYLDALFAGFSYGEIV